MFNLRAEVVYRILSTDYLDDVSTIEYVNPSVYASNSDSHIKFQYLEKLCLIFKCTPNDLLEWRPDNGNSLNEPLKILIHHSDNFFSDLSVSSIEEYAANKQKK